ncbi:hypothetical protein GBA52_025360 [Prunus armeniaca]|nr:hypothetical protein GBA52_025360 [Prunus armeniaca]
MALSLRFYVVFVVLLVSLLVSKASSTSHHEHHHHHHQLKSLHFALFQHETINRTGYIVVNGVGGAGIRSDDRHSQSIFETSWNSSGTSVTSSLDGLQSISVAKITLRLKHHSGSVSIVGGTHNVKPSDHPVVGGTGDFLFVQGYVTSSPVNLKG